MGDPRPLLGPVPVGTWFQVAVGLGIVLLGIAAYHGHLTRGQQPVLDLVLTVPALIVGPLVAGLSFAREWRQGGWLVRGLAVLLIAASLGVFGFVLHFLTP